MQDLLGTIAALLNRGLGFNVCGWQRRGHATTGFDVAQDLQPESVPRFFGDTILMSVS
jgi:hypothetical protein